MSTYYDKLSYGVTGGAAFLAKATWPQRPWVAMIAGCAWWYGRRVAFTYAPGYLANIFINNTIAFMGSNAAGKIVGATIVAPVMTPSVVPWVASATGCLFFMSISAICNLIMVIIESLSKKKTEKTAEAQPV